MNINQNPLSRRESTRPPTPQEREAMRATREQVRTDAAKRQEVIDRNTESARAENKRQTDTIEISVRARRQAAAAKSEGSTRQGVIDRLKNAYAKGDLNTPERRQAAASRMLGGDQG